MADATETQSQLETLRNARCHLAGAVFNRAAIPVRKRRSGRLAAVLALLLTSLAGPLPAQQTNPPTPASVTPPNGAPAAFSISSPAQLASWQKRLTLGPGDVLNISLYDQPDSLRTGLAIGPDGRLNYLQAQDVVAAGLTVDELRERLEQTLAKFYRLPLRVVIIPQAYVSKKYFLLGNVAQSGVFTLDRPVTLLEAIARAQGFASTVQRRNTFMLADLSRSFLVRKGEDGSFKREPVNFEALFLHGDLTQNIGVAPDDYIYFPPLDLQDVYVLGEVRGPGVTPYEPGMTALKSIVTRGGFTERAYRQKVLIVRGSLNQPQTYVVNAAEILNARSLDFRLEPRDIVYVSRRPWSKVEELLELAITDFMRAAVITWTGRNVGPFITEPLF